MPSALRTAHVVHLDATDMPPQPRVHPRQACMERPGARARAGRGQRAAMSRPASWRNEPSPTAPQEHDLQALLARMTQGDADALATFYDATKAMVYGLALRMLRDVALAEDVTIEVFTYVYQRASQYDHHRGTPSAWLVTLTRSRAIDHLRQETLKHAREASLDLVSALATSIPTPEEWSTSQELTQVVRRALVTLTPEQRQVLEVAYYKGLSHGGIAAHLQLPLGTVKTRLRAGLRALRHLLQPWFEGQAQAAHIAFPRVPRRVQASEHS